MDYVKNNRMLSLLGQGGTFGTALFELAQENEKVVAVSADLIRVSGRAGRCRKDPFCNNFFQLCCDEGK